MKRKPKGSSLTVELCTAQSCPGWCISKIGFEAQKEEAVYGGWHIPQHVRQGSFQTEGTRLRCPCGIQEQSVWDAHQYCNPKWDFNCRCVSSVISMMATALITPAAFSSWTYKVKHRKRYSTMWSWRDKNWDKNASLQGRMGLYWRCGVAVSSSYVLLLPKSELYTWVAPPPVWEMEIS